MGEPERSLYRKGRKPINVEIKMFIVKTAEEERKTRFSSAVRLVIDISVHPIPTG